MKKSAKKAKPAINKTEVGAGLAAIAAAAGTYFFYGSKNAPKRRTHVKAWSLKAKGEILKRVEKLSQMDEATYHKIIKEVARKYKTLKRLDPNDVVEFVGELKNHWDDIAAEIARSAAPRPAKKAKRKK